VGRGWHDRGTASETPLRVTLTGSFVSATMSKAVAQAHFEAGPATGFEAIWRQALPSDRLLMSFLETRAMNNQFHEAEVDLLGDPANAMFLGTLSNRWRRPLPLSTDGHRIAALTGTVPMSDPGGEAMSQHRLVVPRPRGARTPVNLLPS
jgi:hypothetical protein